jgi:hypothetical protein
MNLHPSIQAYFDADKRNESGAPLRAFAANAIVEDDGHSHAGHEAIDVEDQQIAALRIGA